MIAGLALLGFLAWSWWQSRLPGSYDVMSYGAVNDGGAQPIAHNHFGVASVTGPKGKPNYKVTLTAEKAPVRLASGQEVNAWTFNGSAPARSFASGRATSSRSRSSTRTSATA